MTHVTCRLTAKNRDQLRNPTLGSRVWATLFLSDDCDQLFIVDTGSNSPEYDGPNRLFELSGLEPYTEYGVQLHACTVAGCTRSPWQRFVTSQAPPANQRAPSVEHVDDWSVLVGWGRPERAYGEILKYEVRRRTAQSAAVSSRASASVASGQADYETVYTTTNATPAYYTHLDTTVLPFTRCDVRF